MAIEVFTDGSCWPTGGPGGWAWVIPGQHAEYGCEQATTNQRMELVAAMEACLAMPDRELVIVSDSAYVVNCFLEGWYRGWAVKGWRNSQGKAVANRDLWEPFIDHVLRRDVPARFTHVRGHQGNPGNEAADLLCGWARVQQIDGVLDEARLTDMLLNAR